MKLAITNATVIDVLSDAPYLGTVIIDSESGLIAQVGEVTTVQVATGVEVFDATGLTVMPGIVDSHCHVQYRQIHSPYDAHLSKSLAEAVLDGVYSARLVLERGFTTIRDLGSRSGMAVEVRNAIMRGDIPGPRMQSAGQLISAPGGLGDSHPSHVFEPNQYGSSQSVLVMDPWDARNQVRKQLKDGVDWIKTSLSGTAVNSRVPAERNDLPEGMFEALMAEAREQGVPVAVHAESRDSVYRAAKHGARSLEHGIYIDEESVDLMLESGSTLVPTLAQYTAGATVATKFGRPQQLQENQARVHGFHVASVRLAYERGIPIAAGGDAGGAHFPQGSAIKELSTLVDLIGLSPFEAIQAGTINGAKLMSLQDEIGTLEPGKSADLVLLTGNPMEDIHVLDEPESIRRVYLRGQLAASRLA